MAIYGPPTIIEDMSILARAAVRTVALAATCAACFVVAERVMDDQGGGANIGVGLGVFALLVVLSGAWAAVDGARLAFSAVAATWGWVAVAIGLLGWVPPILAELSSEGADLLSNAVLASSVTVVFVALLVAVPAVVGAALGSAVADTRASRHRST
jgi:hypothetical protein